MSVPRHAAKSASVSVRRTGSLRRQLIAWNILALALLLGALGLTIRVTVRSFLIASVDRELERDRRFAPPPPGMHGRGGGPPGGGGRPNRGGDRGRSGGGSMLLMPPAASPPFSGMPGQPGERAPGENAALFPERDNPHRRPLPWESRLNYGHHHFDLSGSSIVPNDTRPMWDKEGFNAAAKNGETRFSTVEQDGEPLRVISAPNRERGRVVAVVQIAYPLNDIERAIAGVDRALLTLIPIGLLCAGLGGAYLTDRVLRRVRRATQAAEQMSAADFSARLPVSGNDEFSELAGTFNRLLDRLESGYHAQQRLLEQQRRFTADASHELKTPLTVIKGTASMALSGIASPSRSDETYRRSLSDINRAADTMGHLVQDLLLLARSDAGQLGKQRITVPIRETLERAVAALPPPAEGNSVAPIKIRVADESLCVTGNEAELTRLFTNLLENARRHTPPDGAITLEAVQTTSGGNRVVVRVTDTGVGIAPEHLPHLGERFYRVDESRARPDGGSGLGLSICKSIAEAHGGSLAIQSAPGDGTTVTVRLPGGSA